MNIQKSHLAAAEQAGIITAAQKNKLWLFLEKEQEHVPSFKFLHLLYYFGGFLAIAAITLFVTQAWEQLRGIPLFIICIFMFVLGQALTQFYLKKRLPIPAGIMATFSLVVVPLAIYNLQVYLGLLPPDDMTYKDYPALVSWYWLPMEIITLIMGIIMLYWYRFPFLVFPIALTLWYMSMDLWSLYFQNYNFDARANFSVAFGLFILVIAVFFDLKNKDDHKDYAYWLYLFGVLTFWGGLTCQMTTSELHQFFYLVINVVLVLISVILNQRVFAVFGAFGILGYLGHLAFSVFADSLSFPIALVFLGLLIIFLATRWPAMEQKLFHFLRPYIPQTILKRHNY